ncbi:MAG TPA: galactokinase [Spirochaetia bacterium]|nr:galactokinase [Spirochaetia bacterium]
MNDLRSLHKLEFGMEPEVIASAPGTINLMGEHTDYNEGYVLQLGLNREVSVAISRRKDNSLRFYAADFNERKRTTIANLKYKREDRWANYSKGVLFELLQLGNSFRGVDISISGNVPQGIGLGSSAAVEVATAVAMKTLFDFDLTESQIIQCASRAETVFMGLDSEITDQFVSYIARKGQAVFLDLRSLEYSLIPIELGEADLYVTNSNVPQVMIDPEIRERKSDCKECVEHLVSRKSGNALRDFSPHDLKTSMGVVPEAIRRVCLHVVQENQRVLDAKRALYSRDAEKLGKLMNRSHESLRDYFEVSCPELDWLVKRASEIDGVHGSRMAGPGFGGCTITLLDRKAVSGYVARLDEYERIFGFTAEAFLCEPAGGAHVVEKKLV